MSPAVHRYPVEHVLAIVQRLFELCGMEKAKAESVASSLVTADMLGHSTHGLAIAPWYLEELGSGGMRAAGEPHVISDRGACLAWDGQRLPGAWLIDQAIDAALRRVPDHGVVTCRRSAVGRHRQSAIAPHGSPRPGMARAHTALAAEPSCVQHPLHQTGDIDMQINDHGAPTRRAAIASLAGFLVLAATPPAAHADALSNIERARKIRISIDPAAPPYSAKDTQLAFAGSEVDVARLLAHDWKVELEIVPTNPASRIPYVLTDKTDLVISTLSITAERAKVIDFSLPYSGIQVVVGAPRAMSLRAMEDLATKRIATVRGSTNDTELTKVAPAGAQIIRFDDDATAITAIISGQADCYCTAPALLAPLNQRKPELAMESKLVVKTNLTGIGIRKGEPQLKARLDDWVRENLRNGKLNAIYKKHHGADLSADVMRAANV